jgi:hypothetical protein
LSFNIEDQNELIKTSIHGIILLILQQECKYLNYFNSDEILNQKLLKLFPVFSNSKDYLKKMRNSFQNFKLDDIEFCLFSVLFIISPGKFLLSTRLFSIFSLNRKF